MFPTFAALLAYLVILATVLTGWIMNIVAIAHTMDAGLTVKLALRVIGVVAAPLGAVMGFFG